jgi:MFS family permease
MKPEIPLPGPAAVRPADARAAAKQVRGAGALVVAVLFMGSTLLTPLYGLYGARFGLSTLGVTAVYAVYVVGNLTALLLLGRVSDQVGRRPVIQAATALATASTLLFLFAQTAPWLFAGRVLNGLAVSLGAGAATAWIGDAAPAGGRTGAASLAAGANFAGLAAGPPLAGWLAQYAPEPLRLPFLAYLALLAATVVVATRTPEAARSRPGRLDLKPRLGIPPGVRLAFLAPAGAGFAALGLIGFYAALGPALIRRAFGIENLAVGALIVAMLFLAAAITAGLGRRVRPGRAMRLGQLAILPGLLLLVLAERTASLAVMLAATLLCGAASALSYLGALAVANGLASSENRAEVVSSLWVCCFLGNALPVLGVAALTGLAGPATAHAMFAALLALVTCASLLVGAATRRARPRG